MEKKNLWIIALVAIITIGIIGCGGDDDNSSSVVCNCNPKDHLGIGETCDCGGINCNCTLKVYGEIVDARTGTNIKIYRNGDVSDTEMTAAVANAVAGYGLLNEMEENNLVGKIDEIHIAPITFIGPPNGILSTPSFSYTIQNGKKVVTYRHNRPDYGVQSLFIDIGDGTFTTDGVIMP